MDYLGHERSLRRDFLLERHAHFVVDATETWTALVEDVDDIVIVGEQQKAIEDSKKNARLNTCMAGLFDCTTISN